MEFGAFHRPIACDKPGTAITHYLVSLPFSMLLCGRIVVCAASLLQAWECGVASDTDPEWRARAVELRAYHRQHGDTSVGHRDGDDQDLARYARACCCHLPCVYAGRRRGTVARLQHCHADFWFAHLAFKRQVTLCAELWLQATVQSSGTCVHMLLGLHYMKVVSVSSHCWTPGSSRRWVTAQRRAMSAGLLSGDKLELLQELAFEPDEDEAEWLRWFMDLARCAFQKARRAGGRAGRRAGGRARGREGGRAGGREGGGDIGGQGGGAGRTVGRREGGRGGGDCLVTSWSCCRSWHSSRTKTRPSGYAGLWTSPGAALPPSLLSCRMCPYLPLQMAALVKWVWPDSLPPSVHSSCPPSPPSLPELAFESDEAERLRWFIDLARLRDSQLEDLPAPCIECVHWTSCLDSTRGCAQIRSSC